MENGTVRKLVPVYEEVDEEYEVPNYVEEIVRYEFEDILGEPVETRLLKSNGTGGCLSVEIELPEELGSVLSLLDMTCSPDEKEATDAIHEAIHYAGQALYARDMQRIEYLRLRTQTDYPIMFTPSWGDRKPRLPSILLHGRGGASDEQFGRMVKQRQLHLVKRALDSDDIHALRKEKLDRWFNSSAQKGVRESGDFVAEKRLTRTTPGWMKRLAGSLSWPVTKSIFFLKSCSKTHGTVPKQH